MTERIEAPRPRNFTEALDSLSASLSTGTTISRDDISIVTDEVQNRELFVANESTRRKLEQAQVHLQTRIHQLRLLESITTRPETEVTSDRETREALETLSTRLTALGIRAPETPVAATTAPAYTSETLAMARGPTGPTGRQWSKLLTVAGITAGGLALLHLVTKGFRSLRNMLITGGLAGLGYVGVTNWDKISGFFSRTFGRSPEATKKTAEEEKKAAEARKKLAEEITKVIGTLPEASNLLPGAATERTIAGKTVSIGSGAIRYDGRPITMQVQMNLIPSGPHAFVPIPLSLTMTGVERQGGNLRITFRHPLGESRPAIIHNASPEQLSLMLADLAAGRPHTFEHDVTDAGTTKRYTLQVSN